MDIRREYRRFRDRFRELIEREGMYTIERLDRSLAQGHSQLWTSANSALVTALVSYDGGSRIGQVDWAVGDLSEILSDLMPAAESWLKAKGCTKVMFEGRVGWSRVLKQHGYKTHSMTMVREL